MIELLDTLFRHPVVIAVLSFSLGTGATLWLNQQARERSAISQAVAAVEQGFEQAARLRLSALRLSDAMLADNDRPQPGLLDRIAPLERSQTEQRLIAEAAIGPRTYRLASHLDVPVTNPSAARLLADALWSITSSLDGCAQGMVDETSRGLGDTRFAANRFDECFSGIYRLPETEDPITLSELNARAIRCENYLLGTLVIAMRSRDHSDELYSSGLKTCGIFWQDGAVRFLPVEGIYP
ncbi:MAG: hypothetical protein AAGF94_09215 [Pseudomonadota bacterium]